MKKQELEFAEKLIESYINGFSDAITTLYNNLEKLDKKSMLDEFIKNIEKDRKEKVKQILKR